MQKEFSATGQSFGTYTPRVVEDKEKMLLPYGQVLSEDRFNQEQAFALFCDELEANDPCE